MLKTDLSAAAEAGQALLLRHEDYVSQSEKEAADLELKLDLVISSNRDLLQDNSQLLDQLHESSEALRVSDSKIDTLSVELDGSRERISKLNSLMLQARALESHVSLLETMRESLQHDLQVATKDRSLAELRWHRAERLLEKLSSQYKSLEESDMPGTYNPESYLDLLALPPPPAQPTLTATPLADSPLITKTRPTGPTESRLWRTKSSDDLDPSLTFASTNDSFDVSETTPTFITPRHFDTTSTPLATKQSFDNLKHRPILDFTSPIPFKPTPSRTDWSSSHGLLTPTSTSFFRRRPIRSRTHSRANSADLHSPIAAPLRPLNEDPAFQRDYLRRDSKHSTASPLGIYRPETPDAAIDSIVDDYFDSPEPLRRVASHESALSNFRPSATLRNFIPFRTINKSTALAAISTETTFAHQSPHQANADTSSRLLAAISNSMPPDHDEAASLVALASNTLSDTASTASSAPAQSTWMSLLSRLRRPAPTSTLAKSPADNLIDTILEEPDFLEAEDNRTTALALAEAANSSLF